MEPTKNREDMQMANFRSTLETCQLEDLGYVGSHFTWRNMQEEEHFIKERYEAAWKENKDYNVIIRKVGKAKNRQIEGGKCITRKLEESKQAMFKWRRANRDASKVAINNLTEQLHGLQGAKGELDMVEVRAIKRKLQECMEVEDLKWRQRAKETWLVQGDKNSKYFHACASQRRSANKITSIADKGGNIFTTPQAVEEIFLQYFQGVLTTSNPSGVEECIEVIPGVVNEAMNQELMQAVTMEEVIKPNLITNGASQGPGTGWLSG
ncbi:uncharacterized protein LOC132172089 [Corylus avellana]|uniref:uncharacterized protein LOC132172089 n=1 Tax=Corylus avellana TaxID=13451 RepID=UPI00286CB14E|nr:uncharacterized protein LOC132172089 [Corylus avellana]